MMTAHSHTLERTAAKFQAIAHKALRNSLTKEAAGYMISAGEKLEPNKILFVQNIPAGVSDAHIHQILQMYVRRGRGFIDLIGLLVSLARAILLLLLLLLLLRQLLLGTLASEKFVWFLVAKILLSSSSRPNSRRAWPRVPCTATNSCPRRRSSR